MIRQTIEKPIDHIDPLEVRRVLGRDNWSTAVAFGPAGYRFTQLDGLASVIATCAPARDGVDYRHASYARHDGQMPTYAELVTLHRAVYGERWAYQVFAPPEYHVNIHRTALHLWGRCDGDPILPNFVEHGTI